MDCFSRCSSIKFLTICAIWTLLYLTTFAKVAYGERGIYPPGTIERHVGDEISIMCWTNEKGKNSSNISFYYETNKTEVPRESITIYNETAIIFTIKNAPKMEIRYVCMEDGKDGVDISRVIVGTAPEPVTDFDCRSYDYDYFVCNFTGPKNYVKTTYNLSYTISQQDYICSLKVKNGVYSCNISDSYYRQVHERYRFRLTSKNTYGNLTEEFTINHYDSVIPHKPELTKTDVTPNSVTFEWQVLKYSLYVEKGLLYEAWMVSEYDPRHWKKIGMNERNIEKVNATAFSVTFSNLKYAYTWYDLRVRVKVKTAKNDGTMWSDMYNTTFQTSAKKPDEPPRTDNGGFHIDLSGNLYLYWKEIPRYKYNGPDFHYAITEVRQNGQIVNINATEISLISAKFDSKLINLNDSYEFVIRSKNREGQSEWGNIIRVLKGRKENNKPQQLRKVYHKKKYSLSWEAPKNKDGLINYTVFWCESKIESSDQCQNSTDFKHVSENETNITHPQEGSSTMNFAVAANYRGFSSGMVWAKCTALKTSDFGKMELILTPIGPNSINIQWKVDLECVYTSILEGYHLTYCPIQKPSANPQCVEDAARRNITIPKNATEFTVSDLKPRTTYKFVMFMYSAEKQGPPSDFKQQTTLEAAPTPPRNLTYMNLTNSSVDLMWTIPESMNGDLRHYEITYNGKKIQLEGDNSTYIKYTLRELNSYYDYIVSVVARTNEDSNSSNIIHFKTLIGEPGVVGKIIHTTDTSELTFTWEPPERPAGRLDFYEVLSTRLKDNKPEVNVISKVNGTKCRVRLPACLDTSHWFQFSVRAVNAADKSRGDYHIIAKRDIGDADKYFDLERNADIIITRVSPIFKRHSHAEIDLIGIESSHQENHVMLQENHVRHNRQERDNPSNSHFYQRPLEEYTDDILGFKCLEDDPQLEKMVTLYSGKHVFLRGESKQMLSYLCNYEDDSKRKILLIFGVLVSFVSLVVFYFCGQKYKRMKNIDVVLPPGLTDLDQEIHKGIDNMITNHDIMRSDESIFKNENHHLLAGSGNDSSYLHGINCSDKSDSYDLSDPMKEDEHSAQSDSVELSDMSNSSNGSPADSPNVQRSDKKIASTVVSPIIINGYVQPQKIPEQVFSGYTTLDAFGKPIIPAANTMSTDSKCKEPGINENICGYVTHKQLSDFGHRLQ